MNNDSPYFDRIERYLRHEMDAGEKTVFENDMASSRQLQAEMKIHILADDLVIENRLKDITTLFDKEHSRATQQERLKKWALLVLLLATLAIVATYMTHRHKVSTPAITKSPIPSINYQIHSDTSKKIQLPTLRKVQKQAAGKHNLPNTRLSDRSAGAHQIPNIDSGEIVFARSPETTHTAIAQEEYNPCIAQQILGHAGSRNACVGKDDGSIFIYGMQGGTAPYAFSVKDTANVEKNPSQLFAGIYSVIITDSKHCVKVINKVVVPAKSCAVDYAFNPFVEEVWEVPVSDQPGQLKIYDQTGSIYFEQEVPAGKKVTWNGASENGEIHIGYFIFIIAYSDGTERQGSITIVQ